MEDAHKQGCVEMVGCGGKELFEEKERMWWVKQMGGGSGWVMMGGGEMWRGESSGEGSVVVGFTNFVPHLN